MLVHEQAGTMRYRLLEPIRQYAQDLLQESGAARTVHGEHVHYFLRIAQDAEPRMLDLERQVALEKLEDQTHQCPRWPGVGSGTRTRRRH